MVDLATGPGTCLASAFHFLKNNGVRGKIELKGYDKDDWKNIFESTFQNVEIDALFIRQDINDYNFLDKLEADVIILSYGTAYGWTDKGNQRSRTQILTLKKAIVLLLDTTDKHIYNSAKKYDFQIFSNKDEELRAIFFPKQ